MGLRPLYFLSMKKVILLFLIIFPLFAHGQISISNLNEATTINSSDLFLLTQGSSSKKLKYNTLQTKMLNTVIPWSDTLINGKMVSKYYLYNQLLTKINWIDTLSPNGKLLKFVNNHSGTSLVDTLKLITKYSAIINGITTSKILFGTGSNSQFDSLRIYLNKGGTTRLDLNPNLNSSASVSAYLFSTTLSLNINNFHTFWQDQNITISQLSKGGTYYANALRAGLSTATSYSEIQPTYIRIKTAAAYRTVLSPNVSSTGTATAYLFDTENALTTSGDKLVSVQNHTSEKFSIDKDGNTAIVGDITYKYRHAIASVNGITYTPNLTQNVPFKLLPGMTVVDTVGVTFVADSAKLLKAGDWRVRVFSNISSAANDDFTIQLRVNNSLVTTSAWQGTTSGATNYLPVFFEWYLHNVTVNSYLSFRIVNTANNNDPTIRYFKLDIDKVPE